MQGTDEVTKSPIRHLTLDDVKVNLKLARRLSPTVACRYHALPVAEGDGYITVAMANPDDPVAREAVAAALDAPSCVVGSDRETIDALLAEVWPEGLQSSTRVLIFAVRCPTVDAVSTFAQALGDLLGAHFYHYTPTVPTVEISHALEQEAERGNYDLVIWGEPDQRLFQQLCSGPVYGKVVERMPTSFLVARRPRWPLKRLLLVVQGEEIDDPAVDWTLRLARPSGAAVTALAVLPSVPAMYDQYTRMQQGLDKLLSTDTALGRQMRQVARRLVDWEVEGTLRLCQGIPSQEIQFEVTREDYDLIVLARHRRAACRRWLMGDWVTSLLSWADRPVLVALRGTAKESLKPNLAVAKPNTASNILCTSLEIENGHALP